MQLPADVEQLHRIAEYHSACRALRKMGWGGIVFGIINVGLGMDFIFGGHFINIVVVLFGLLLLGAGLWCLVLPGAEGTLAYGIVLVLVGLWNLFVAFLSLVVGRAHQVWWAIISIFLFVAAIQCFKKYARFSTALRHRVSKEERAMMNKLVKTIINAKAKENDDLITIQVRTFGQQKNWRGRLAPHVAVFVDKMSKEVLVARKEEARIEPHGKVLLGQSLKASVKIRDYRGEGLISPLSFDRFRDWKFSEDEEECYRAEEVDADQREPGVRVKDEWDQPPTDIQDGKG